MDRGPTPITNFVCPQISFESHLCPVIPDTPVTLFCDTLLSSLNLYEHSMDEKEFRRLSSDELLSKARRNRDPYPIRDTDARQADRLSSALHSARPVFNKRPDDFSSY